MRTEMAPGMLQIAAQCEIACGGQFSVEIHLCHAVDFGDCERAGFADQ